MVDAANSPRSWSEWELLRARDSALESNRKQVDMLETQNAQLRANADALEDEVSRLGSELAEARDDADAAAREVSDLRNDLERVEEERDRLQGSSEAVKVRLTTPSCLLRWHLAHALSG